MLLAVGLLSAILEARSSNEGQVIDVAMVDGVATLMAVYYGMLAEGTWRDRRYDNLLDGAAHFYGVYETADGRHFAVGAIEPQFYAELCERLAVTMPQDNEAPEAWATPPRHNGRTLSGEDLGGVGRGAGLARVLRRARPDAHRGAPPSAQRRSGVLRGGVRRPATGSVTALLADRPGLADRAGPARRPHTRTAR